MATTLTLQDSQGEQYVFVPENALVLGSIIHDSGTYTVQGLSAVKVAFAFNDATPTSTASIPGDHDIYIIRVIIDTLFDGTAPTLAVATDGASPKTLIETTDFDITVAEQYGNDDLIELGADEGGHLDVTVVIDGSTTGAGSVVVFYTQSAS